MPQKFDVIILGAGNAGFGVSVIAHEAGKRIAFVEAGDFGGTCPNRGCVPKKVLVAAAHALHEIARAPTHGIDIGPARLDWGALIAREKEMIRPIPESMAELAAERGQVFRGRGRFVGANAIEVDGERLEAEHVVVATGSQPRPLNFPGAEHMITSDEVLSESALPGEVIFIGGGVIALEFCHVYARAGAKVTILEAAPRLLSDHDADAVAQLQAVTEKLGVRILTDVEVAAIEPEGGRLGVRFGHDGTERTLSADRIVNGAGRVACLDDLGLDAAGVTVEHGGIVVDDYLRSVSNPQVWAAGDTLTVSPQLSPLATYEGQIVGRNIVDGPRHQADWRVVPSGVFTVPALSSVGLSEEQAKDQGLRYEAEVNDMSDWFSSRTYAEDAAWSKTLVDPESGRILGAHLLGHRGEDLIHLFALAMKHGLTASDLREQLYAFPTFSADMKSVI